MRVCAQFEFDSYLKNSTFCGKLIDHEKILLLFDML